MACFGWRALKNRREVGGLASLTPTSDQSGESARDQGIIKSGNRHVRWRTMEVAWSWVRYQPESALSGGLRERFGGGGAQVAHGAGAIPRDRALTRGGGSQRGVSDMAVLNQASLTPQRACCALPRGRQGARGPPCAGTAGRHEGDGRGRWKRPFDFPILTSRSAARHVGRECSPATAVVL
jgi:hypothetical protein